jgi:hypothetical protein
MYMDMDLYMNWGSSVAKKIKFQAREGGGGVNGETLRMEEKMKET